MAGEHEPYVDCLICAGMHKIWHASPENTAPWYTPLVHFNVTGQLCAATRLHPPTPLDETALSAVQQELQAALLDWVQTHTRWSKDRDPVRAAAFARYGLFSSRAPSIPAFVTLPLSDLDREYLDEIVALDPDPAVSESGSHAPIEHPVISLNIYELRSYAWLPTEVSDACAHAAQEFVGYFDPQRRRVRSGQMAALKRDALGRAYDPSVQTEGVWSAPFEPPDDCIFCQRTTDERVMERIDGFQWALDKELVHNVLPINEIGGYPREYAQPGEWEKRQAFREEQIAWERAHPEGLHAFYLPDLPWQMQRTLVTKWNHIWRDWLAQDALFDEQDGNVYTLVNRKVSRPEIVPPYVNIDVRYERVIPFEDLPVVEALIGASFQPDRDSAPAVTSTSMLSGPSYWEAMVAMWGGRQN